MIRVDLGHELNAGRVVLVMRERVMGIRHTDLRIRAGALLAAEHEGHDPCQVGLEREELQVEHQLEVLLELPWGWALGLVDERRVDVALRLSLLNPALDVPHRLCVLLDLDLRPSSRCLA